MDTLFYKTVIFDHLSTEESTRILPIEVKHPTLVTGTKTGIKLCVAEKKKAAL